MYPKKLDLNKEEKIGGLEKVTMPEKVCYNQAIEDMAAEIKERADVERLAKTMYDAGEKASEYRQLPYDKLPKEDKKILLMVAQALSKYLQEGLE
jgi:hypothetical protein